MSRNRPRLATSVFPCTILDDVLEDGKGRHEGAIDQRGPKYPERHGTADVLPAEPHRLADQDDLGDDGRFDQRVAVVERVDPELAGDQPPICEERTKKAAR